MNSSLVLPCSEDQAIPSRFASVSDMIASHARCRPNDIAWQAAGEHVTWKRFDEMTSSFARVFLRHGLQKGASVALLVDSSIQSWAQIIGAMRAGGVATPLSTMLDAEAIAMQLADARSTHLVASPSYEALAIAAAEKAWAQADRPFIFCSGSRSEETLDIVTLAAEADTRSPLTVLHPQDPATIIYSSGTTGRPKGIVHTHEARAQMGLLFACAFRCPTASRALLTTMPHTNGSFMIVLPMLVVGGTIHVTNGFDPDQYLDQIREFRPTLAFMVPTMAQALVDHPRAAHTDWSCFEFIVTAGAPMSQELKLRTREMAGDRLGELWGLTEGVATVIEPREVAGRPTSVGRPVPTCEIRVIDTDDNEVAVGEIGEIVGYSALAMSHYLGRPDATLDIIWRSPEGRIFLRTGDLGSVDDDGWLSIKGRKKDMLISGGLNIYPADIEEVLSKHPSVTCCAVAGVPHRKWGETPVAFVTIKPDGAADPAELRQWVNNRVGRHQRLHDLVLVDAFPRNALGKIMKFRLVESYLAPLA